MQAESIQSELRDFVQFASSRVANGEDRLSFEDLVRQWRQTSEFTKTIEDVRGGITDAAQGKAQPISDAFAEVRRKLGIAD